MTTKPVWFLDVDGVINAVGHGRHVDESSRHYEHCKAGGAGSVWDIYYAPDVIEFINTMHGQGLLEVRWLTTWAHEANDDLSYKLGIKGPFEVAGRPPVQWGYRDWWKLDCVKAFVKENPETPIIWTDDDLTSSVDAVEWVDAFPGKILAICPPTRYGLVAEDLRAIAQFVLDCSSDTINV